MSGVSTISNIPGGVDAGQISQPPQGQQGVPPGLQGFMQEMKAFASQFQQGGGQGQPSMRNSTEGQIARLNEDAGRLQQQKPQDATSYQTNQSAQALTGDAIGLVSRGAGSAADRRELTQEIGQLSRAQTPDQVAHVAQRIGNTLDKIQADTPSLQGAGSAPAAGAPAADASSPDAGAPAADASSPDAGAPAADASSPDTGAPTTDASSPDAGAPAADASSPDTGAPTTDASSPDAGAPAADASSPDAGAPAADASSPDAGAPAADASSPDAGAPAADASSPDAGAPTTDASSPDAGAPAADASSPDQAAGSADASGSPQAASEQAPPSDPTPANFAQAKSDLGYLQQAAQQPPGGQSPGRNLLTPQVSNLIDTTNSEPKTAATQPLRGMEGDLMSISANAGGRELPASVNNSLQNLINSVGTAVRGQVPLQQATGDIGTKLGQFVQSLAQATGGAYGTQDSLKAFASDLSNLSQVAASQAPAQMAQPPVTNTQATD